MWPVASWSSLEYGGKWKHLQYHAKRFFKDVTVFAVPRDLPREDRKPNRSSGEECARRWEIWVANDLPRALDAKVDGTLWSFGGQKIGSRTAQAKVPAGTAVKVVEFDATEMGSEQDLNSRFGKLRLTATDANGAKYEDDNELIPKRWKKLRLEKATVKTAFDGFKVTLTTDRPAFYTWAEARGIRGEFDRNSFALLPGEPVTLVFRPKDAKVTPEAFRKAFSVTHLRETYR